MTGRGERTGVAMGHHARLPRDQRSAELAHCAVGGKVLREDRLGEVDTMRRYIYIHGSPDSAELGKPGSIGCVRMRNRDVAELFDLVPAYTPVSIR